MEQQENNHYIIEQLEISLSVCKVTDYSGINIELPFVFTIPGEIAHVDATKDNSFEANKKTFIDFFMIANAEKVYLAHRGKMFYSGFPRTAALSANKPFEVIEF